MTAIALSWSAATDDHGVAGYRVRRDGAIVATVTGTSHTDSGLAADTAYAYSVEAFDDAGQASAQSGPITVTTRPMISQTLAATADGYVAEDTPTTSFGTKTALRVDASPVVRSFLRFDVAGVTGPIHRVLLTVPVGSGSRTGFFVRRATSSTWTESDLTFATQPGFDASPSFASGPILRRPETWSLPAGRPVIKSTGSESFWLARL